MPSQDRTIAEIARRRHGVVTRRQLAAAGLTTDAITTRLRRGSLIRVHRGVFRVGHVAPSVEASYLAAVLACGDGALLRGRAAGWLLGLVPGGPPPVEVVTRTERRIEGVTTVRSRGHVPGFVWRGVPVTSVPRTVVDLASVLCVDDLARAVHEAGIRFSTRPDDVLALAPRSRALRRVLLGDVHVTLSALERRFLRVLRAAGLPLPETNGVIEDRRVDCWWPGLTVELDGYRYHSSRYAWELDRRREREARARGDDFRRFTFDDVFLRPGELVSELRSCLVKA